MTELETFTPAEREYFNTRGEKGILGAGDPVEKETDTEAEIDADVEELDTSEANEPEDSAETEPEDEPGEEQPKKKDNGRVPLRKLRAEEDRRKEVERQFEELKEKFTRGDERLRMIMEAQQRQAIQEQPAKQEAPPDPVTDPIRAIEWQQQQLEQQRQWQEQQLQSQREAAAIAQIDDTYRKSWGNLANAKPDALNAYQHFINVTSGYLEMQGVPQANIDDMVANEERKIAYQAMQRGISPAEIIYEKAQMMGYRPAPVAPSEPDNTAAKKAEEDVARRQKAASASKSLSSAGGSRGGSTPSIEELANMSEDDFADFRAKVGERQFRKIMGE